MTLTFDLYTHRNKIYHYLVKIAIVGFLAAGICLYATNLLQSSKFLYGSLVAIIIIYILFMLTFMSIVSYGMLQLYEKDGELLLSDDMVTIDGEQIHLNVAEKIFFDLRPRTIKSGWRRIGNRIEIIGADGKAYNRRFCINSYDHNQELLQLLNVWSEKEVKYKIEYAAF